MAFPRVACLAWLAVLGAASVHNEGACTPENECEATGHALLQKAHARVVSEVTRHAAGEDNVTTTRPVLEPPPHLFDLLEVDKGLRTEPRQGQGLIDEEDEGTRALLREAGYSADGYQGAPSCVPLEVEAERRQAAFFALGKQRDPVGMSASLDAAGFLATTSLCCPHEMEQFFGRLLHARGLDVCSKPHVQGLMHWFSCVPDMDFQYVLEVIEEGNPCKYWAPKGETCPKLSASCAGEYCGHTPTKPKPKNTTTVTTTTTTTTTTNVCEGDVELIFENATKSENNVGGKGPDKGTEHLRLHNLGSQRGKAFDLLVSSTSDRYTTPEGYAQYNGVYGYFGYLTMSTGTQFDIKFQFVETNTTTPMTLDKFYFTFFDLDTGDINNNGTAAEQVSAFGYEKYFVGAGTELKIEKNDKGGESFKATMYGTGADNPKDPLKLTQQQQDRAVTFQFLEKSEFEATYTVSPGASVGRDIYFAGKSQLALNPCFGEDPFEEP